MTIQNIQIGIDLGTTNSEIAVNHNGNIEIVKNNYLSEFTPSVFGFDELRNPIVGKKAYEKLYGQKHTEDDIKNYKAEVKRIMGTSEKVFFPRVKKFLTPEEISSEILKSLKHDVLKKYRQIFSDAAVVTTPASFDTVQAEATKRAGNLAGFKYVVLLQEPIAAAIAYGYSNLNNEKILTYDLGGGTFDTAIISSKDGHLSVLSHNGDNFLGGKDIDKIIVNDFIVPNILSRFKIQDFSENNPKFNTEFLTLKGIAEDNKIYLSQELETSIDIINLGKDDRGQDITLSLKFSRKQLEQLIKPLVDRTIEIAKKTIEDAEIPSTSINKIILVGGPTQIPYIRKRLEDDLKIPIDTSIDPITAVAKGASIFALGQQIPENIKINESIEPGTKKITLFFNSLTSDSEETITGIIEEFKNTNDKVYLLIQSDSGHYTSGRILIKDGKFFETVTLIPRKTNIFWIYLSTEEGNQIPIIPDNFSITQGLSVEGAPIPHSIGVGIAERDIENSFSYIEKFEPIFKKGSLLPLTSDFRKYRTARPLKKGEDNFLPIKIYEGESDIPERNTFICDVKIKGTELPFDLQEGTDIELLIKVDESRELTLEVYLPIVDRTFPARGIITSPKVDPKELEKQFSTLIDRYKNIAEDCSVEEKLALNKNLSTIGDRLKNFEKNDPDENLKLQKQIRELALFLDGLEKEKQMPKLKKDFYLHISAIEDMINKINPDSKTEMIDLLNSLKKEGEQAISNDDKFLLTRVNDQLFSLGTNIYFSQPGAWAHYFNRIIENNEVFLNPKEAEYYIEKGKVCIQTGNLNELRVCVRKLERLLPMPVLKSVISGITH